MAAFAASLVLRGALDTWLFPDRGLILFIPAIILVTFFAGLGPGIATAVLSGATAWYFFLPPFYSMWLSIDGGVGLATFVLGSSVSITLVHWLRLSTARAEVERARAEALARQRAEAERRVGADLRDMTRLNQLGNELARAGIEPSRCLDEVVEAAMAIAGAQKGNVQLLDESTGTLTIAAQRGFDAPFLTFFRQVSNGASACATAMRSAGRVVVEDVQASDIFKEPAAREILASAGVRSVISTPLNSGAGALMGVLSIHFAELHRPGERELHFLDLLARQASDYLERQRAEEIKKVLIREVEHRSSNLLAIIQAVAHLSLSGDRSLAQAKTAFEARLQSLARANRQLTRSNWSGVSLADLVRLELEPFAGRSTLDGIDVILRPQQAQNFSLALHELATNAAKYGALSVSGGSVKISWTIASQGGDNLLKFRWQEQGGPPVTQAKRGGFGTVLIRSLFKTVQLSYAVEGLCCELDVLLDATKGAQPSVMDAALM